MNNKEILLLTTPILIFVLIVILKKIISYLLKEKFDNKDKIKVKDFDKNVIELDTLKYDNPKIKDFVPKKTSELELFCKQDIDSTKMTCYKQ